MLLRPFLWTQEWLVMRPSATMGAAGIVGQITSARVFPWVEKAFRPGRARYFTMNQINPTSTSTNAMPVMIRIARNRPSIGPVNVEALSGSHQCIGLSSVSSFTREAEVRRLGLASRHRHAGGLRAVLLMPRLDRVRPGRQTLEREAPVRAAHAEERMRQHGQPRMHPAVHVALERHHHFRR